MRAILVIIFLILNIYLHPTLMLLIRDEPSRRLDHEGKCLAGQVQRPLIIVIGKVISEIDEHFAVVIGLAAAQHISFYLPVVSRIVTAYPGYALGVFNVLKTPIPGVEHDIGVPYSSVFLPGRNAVPHQIIRITTRIRFSKKKTNVWFYGILVHQEGCLDILPLRQVGVVSVHDIHITVI